MTYGNKQIGLELRNTFRGLPDEFMDVVVGGLQVWRFLCHLPRELTESAIGARDKGRKAFGPFSGGSRVLCNSSPESIAHLPSVSPGESSRR